jgi:Fe-S cluster biogenesis protein NfuA
MKPEIEISTEFTPNPASLKFNVNKVLLESGSAFFAAPEEAGETPLAQKLMAIPLVKAVLIGRDFVTITRTESAETWAGIIPPVSRVLKDYLASGEPIIVSQAKPAHAPAGPESEIEMKIQQILDQKIRPAVARDGGDIIFHQYKDGVVTLHLQGACSACPSAIATLKAGVERMLREYVPEVREVVQV